MLAGAIFSGPALAWSPARAAGPAAWRAYDTRLRARLADAGGGRFERDFAQALLRLNNAFRAEQQLAPYRWDEGLAEAARAHAADMTARDFFGHEAPEGFTPFDRASLLARDLCGPIAENVAWRSDDRRPSNPRQFEDLWETSPGHRRNLLREDYTHAGYGVVRVGAKYVAAGVYGGEEIRLPAPLPMRLASGEELVGLLNGSVERLAITAPGENPRNAGAPPTIPPVLSPGVWQLRPMKATAPLMYSVLAGPVFFVG